MKVIEQSAEPMQDEEEEESERAGDDDNGEEEVAEERNGEAFHPSAPPSELFDMPTTVDPSYIISLIRKLLPPRAKNDNQFHGGDDRTLKDETGVSNFQNGDTETINTVENSDGLDQPNGAGDNAFRVTEGHVIVGDEEVWEGNGCILWDLAANKTHAELMVENLLLEVLLASLTLSQSMRITEISLGILANLACHECPRKCIFSTKGLVNTVVDQLFLDDSPCLCEAFRLLTLGLQGTGSISLVETLQQEHVLERIFWITENTLNSQLLEKSLGLLLGIIENQQGEAQVLIPPMEKLGLVSILINLLACEMDKISNQRMPERYSVLDMILHVIEALSVIEDFSDSISSSNKLLQLVFDLVKLPDKVEVSSCCVTAVVLIANILTDVPDAVAEVSQDLSLLQGLLDTIPFVSDDVEARRALWSVLGRVFSQVQDDVSPSMLCHYVSLLVDKSDFIEEDLVDHRLEESDKDQKSTSKLDPVTASLTRMHNILNQWTTIKGGVAESNVPREDRPNDEKVHRLLHLCCKYTEQD